jgi:hypothetical protein
MAMSVLSSHATLTGVEEKKTGPSRFIADFSSVTLDPPVEEVPGAKFQVQGWRCGSPVASRMKGSFHVRFSGGSNLFPLTRQLNSYHPPTLYVNIKNAPFTLI